MAALLSAALAINLVYVRAAGVGPSLDGVLASRPENFVLLRSVLADTGFGRFLESRRRPVTLFAPTDSAVRRFLQSWGLDESTLHDLVQRQRIWCLLSYATLKQQFRKSTLSNSLPKLGFSSAGHRASALGTFCDDSCTSGPACWRSLILHADKHGGGELLAGGGVVISADVHWRNGMVHVIDAVPNPVFWAPHGARNLKSLLDERSDLRLLRGALQAVKLDECLERNGLAGATYTIFAPTDFAMSQFLQSKSMTESQFLEGGDSKRRTAYVLRQLIARGFGDESDLWRAAASRGGRSHIDTFCPCGGHLTLHAFGHAGARSLQIEGGRFVLQNQMWLGGIVHIIDVMPSSPCWSEVPSADFAPPVQAPMAAAVSQTPTKPSVSLSTVSDSCSATLDQTLAGVASLNMKLFREAFNERGLSERLETWHKEVTVFTVTDKALKDFMRKYSVSEDHLFQQGWQAEDCVQQLFKGLAHQSKLDARSLKRWARLNSGSFELPTLCGNDCSQGLNVSMKNGLLLIGAGSVLAADLKWCNGLVHIIDEMPVPEDWAPDTDNCRKQPEEADAASMPKVTRIEANLLPSSTPSAKEPVTAISVLFLAVIVFLATIALASIILLLAMLWFRGMRKVARVKPEETLEVYEPPVKKVMPGVAMDVTMVSIGKKLPPGLTLDLEHAMVNSETGDQDSEPSTRCPSSRSLSTISVTSSLLSSAPNHSLRMAALSTPPDISPMISTRTNGSHSLALHASDAPKPGLGQHQLQVSNTAEHKQTRTSLRSSTHVSGQLSQELALTAYHTSSRRSRSAAVSSRSGASLESRSRSSRPSGSHQGPGRARSLPVVQEQPDVNRSRSRQRS